MLETLPRPTIFAHRGASAHAPENTLAAFELALAQGAEGIELDAKLSRMATPLSSTTRQSIAPRMGMAA